MGGVDAVVSAWNDWGLQALVLLSFTLQVSLLVLAELRRRMDSGVVRVFTWSAYMLADATAIYVLGHLSATVKPPEHQLKALWAPFLLLHLGGQDNITAYSIEDTQLWLRHLQTLSLQVAAAAYVVYKSAVVGPDALPLLRWATILVFAAGTVKYGERVWALRRAVSSASGNNYRFYNRFYSTNYREPHYRYSRKDAEDLLVIGHLELPIAMDMLKGSLPIMDVRRWQGPPLHGAEVYEMIEAQLSLMHDVLYTRSEVTHTWLGLCLRNVSLLATVIAFSLSFQQLQRVDDHRRMGYSLLDVAVTRVLMLGAVVLEIASTLRALFSSWTCASLVMSSPKSWGCKVVLSLRRLVHAVAWRKRYWSRSMGQNNTIYSCIRSRASRWSRMARWMGFEDPWNVLVYSASVPVSECVKKLVVKHAIEDLGAHFRSGDQDDRIVNSRGRAALESCSRGGLALQWSLEDYHEMGFEESIILWHAATWMVLFEYEQQRRQAQTPADEHDLALAIQALSNYMVYLLAARPYMLPLGTSRKAYIEACYAVVTYLQQQAASRRPDEPSVL